jgi:methyl-accepting chemotaxis protein
VSGRDVERGPVNETATTSNAVDLPMSDMPVNVNGHELDAAKLAELTDYLGLTQEALERLQCLRDQVHETLNDEFNIVATDLTQLRRLLSDAAEKLSGTFRVVTASSEDMRTTIAQVQDVADIAVLRRISEIAGEMTSTTGQTIQSLQFEDMATQLLQHVDKKLAVLARFAKDMAVINPTTARVPPLLRSEQLDELFARLASYRNELTVATRKVVQQESLESGDIELF